MPARRPLAEVRSDPAWPRGALIDTPLGTMHAVVDGSGPDVLLIHGVTDSVLTWHELRAGLGSARVHALDLPGHGLSDVPDAALTPREMARWVSAYFDAAGIERAVVVGWSLGGGVSVELAAMEKARVRALVLVAAAAVPIQMVMSLRLLTLPLSGELMPSIGSRPSLCRRSMRDTYGPGFVPSDAVLERYFRGWEIAERARYIRGLLRALSFEATCERIPEITVPSWVLHGAQDRLVPVGAGRQLAERLPNARLEVLEGVGHSPHLERPEAVLAAIHAALEAARAQ
jgi:pimeloyl-ACP methyl ester carboxylesterase